MKNAMRDFNIVIQSSVPMDDDRDKHMNHNDINAPVESATDEEGG